MSTTNNVATHYGQTLALICGPSPRALAGIGTGAGAEVDCRSALLTAVAELTPALRPVRTLLDACRDNPGRFQTEVLGRRLWTKQVEVCQAIARSPITVVPAGRAVGKSFLLAGVVLWWVYTRPGSLVVTTGPDHRQAESPYMGVDIGGGVGADRSVVVVRSQKQILAVFASEWHGVLDEARHRLEPVVVELARKWGVTPDRLENRSSRIRKPSPPACTTLPTCWMRS